MKRVENMNNLEFLDKMTLDFKNNEPLYLQLFTLIKKEIQQGTLKPGDTLPPENQLCKQFNLSRSTVRLALNKLAEENMIIRRRGKGTFIADFKVNRKLNHLYNFTEDMIQIGIEPKSIVIENKVIEADEEMKDVLGLTDVNSKVYKLVRLRLADDEPLLFENTFIPLYLCPDIVYEDFSKKSLYNFLRTRYNLHLYKAVETFEASKAGRDVASKLNCKPSDCVFRIQRVAYLDTGIAFELTKSYEIASKCKLEIELFTDKNNINFIRTTRL